MIGATISGSAAPRQAGSPSPGGGRAKRGLERALLATRILIVEDEAMIAWTLESYCEDMGFTAIELAASGEEAIEAAGISGPGLIISDINLGSGVDGIQAAATITALASRVVPVLFITGYASDDTRTRIDRGIPGAMVLSKPVQFAELDAAITATLSRTP